MGLADRINKYLNEGIKYETARKMAESEEEYTTRGEAEELAGKEDRAAREKTWEAQNLIYQQEKEAKIAEEEEREEYRREKSKVAPIEEYEEIDTIPEKKEEIEPEEKKKTYKYGIFGGLFKEKSEKEKEREAELKEAQEEAKYRQKLRAVKLGGSREPREPSLKDIGKGSMGAKKYAGVSEPDFFGTKNLYSSPQKAPSTYIKEGGKRAPSTYIPFGGTKPPSTHIVSGGKKAPSTRIPYGGSKAPETKVFFGGKPSTRVPTEKGKIISTKFGSARPSVNVPLVRGKPVSTRIKGSKPKTRIQYDNRPPSLDIPYGDFNISEVQVGKPKKIKTGVKKPKQNVLDVLGLKGYW